MKVSVALCTYNGEKFLEQQIDSILFQTLKVDEIVVCDDGSVDGTIAILENYRLKNPDIFKIYKNEVNLRSVKNFEKAIALCSGALIFLSDQDDIWVKNKVEKYVEFFENHPAIDVLASNGFCIDEHATVHDKYSIWDVPQFLKEKNIAFNYYTFISFLSNIATGSTMAFRKKIVPEIIPIPELKDFHHDEWIGLLSAKNNSFELLNEKYYYYRIHSNQQVGGVFFDKNDVVKNKFIEIFDINNLDYSFSSIKSKIKRLIISYKKNINLSELNTAHQKYFLENTVQIKDEILKMNALMKEKYYFRNLFISFTDKILNKRQLPFK